MQNNFDFAYFREPQDAAVKAKTTLREGKAVVTPFPTKAGIAGLLPGFDPAEESLEGKVNADSDILQNLGMNAGEREIINLKMFQEE
jgi:hypothetical protein